VNDPTPKPNDSENVSTQVPNNVINDVTVAPAPTPAVTDPKPVVSTGINKYFFFNKGWRGYTALAFILIFAGWGVYALLNSFAATPSATKTWSTAADWNGGALSNTVVAGNAVTLASTTTSGGTAATTTTTSSCSSPTIVLNNSGSSITDSAGAKWTVTNGVVYKNGNTAGYSSNVTEIAYVGTTVWQENSSNMWYSWNGSGWSGGTSTSPVSSGSTSTTQANSQTTYASSGTVTLTFNAGSSVTWNTLTDQTTAPSGTTIATQVRTSTDGTNWSTWSTNISQAAASQYLQIQATLTTTTTTVTPTLTSLTLAYTPPAGTPTPTPTPTPTGGTGSLTTNCSNAAPGGTDATVNFCSNLNVPALNTYSIGDTISEFGYPNNNIANQNWRNTLAALGPLAWRLALRMNGASPVAGAGGGNGDGTAYINEIRQMNGVPVVIAAGKSGDYDIDPTMSSQLVHYFDDNGGQHGGPIKLWIIGNEPDNGGQNGINQYTGALNATASAMKQADGSIQISAPAAAYFDDNLMGAAKNAAGQYIDIMSYHAYTGADNTQWGTGVYTTPEFLNEAQHVKNTYGKTPAVEESNWHFDCAGNGPGYSDWQGGAYIASMIGNSLAGGAVHAYMYADSGGCGTLYNNGTPMPAYYGLGIWTGMNGQFDRFGSQLVDSNVGGVDVTNAGKNGLSQQVELFATNNGKIVAINKNGGNETITIGLGGVASGSYDVWQTDTTQAIKQVQGSTNFTGSKITITLPAHTVSSIDIK
jgi:hypothetical protein